MRTLGLADPAFVAATAIAPSGYDIDAAAYITAVETADGQALETAVADAINAFVVGCKADGIWDAIKACCILAGARTLNGALVPLVGTAPTRQGTEVGWNYNRKTGLAGNETDTYLNSNRANNSQSQNNIHIAVRLSSAMAANTAVIGAVLTSPSFSISQILNNAGQLSSTLNSINGSIPGSLSGSQTGFIGWSRASSATINARANSNSYSLFNTSTTPNSLNYFIFARNLNESPNFYTPARASFYSIGEALDLALLDARVTTLINAFAAAIP